MRCLRNLESGSFVRLDFKCRRSYNAQLCIMVWMLIADNAGSFVKTLVLLGSSARKFTQSGKPWQLGLDASFMCRDCQLWPVQGAGQYLNGWIVNLAVTQRR